MTKIELQDNLVFLSALKLLEQLTEKGLELAKQGERMRDDYLRELFSYLGDDDVADLNRVVRRMNAYFETKRSDADQGGEGGRACASRDGEDGPACA